MITITFLDNDAEKKLQVLEQTPVHDLCVQLGITEQLQKRIIAMRVNNEICSLNELLKTDARVEPVYIDSTEGSAIYRRTLCFVLAAAAHTLFPSKRLVVGHSLGYGYYYTLEKDGIISTEDVDSLRTKMQEIINNDRSIEQKTYSYVQATECFEKLNLIETRKQLNYHCNSYLTLNTLDDFADLYFAPLARSTGVLHIFELLPYSEGFLLRFPQTHTPDLLTPFVDEPKLFSVYKRYKDWGKLIGITSAASINQIIHEKQTKQFVDITETMQAKCFAETADAIQKKGNVKVILIAGPSSSGKTTSSKKLAMQLQVNGYNPKIISLDDYYIGRELTPKDEDGNYDYECLEALNIKLLNDNLIDLFDGKEVNIPSYDFTDGKAFYKPNKTLKIAKNDILILEGIHALNDKLTPLISNDIKYKVYVSALTQLNLDDHNRVPTSDNRLIRRIVRDYQFRGKSATETIGMWPNVQKGERLHIFPFQGNADSMINTALDYELPVLKTYAEPLLRCVPPTERAYSEATRLLGFLHNFSPISAQFVPGQSIIREFIGGSEFKY